MHQFPALPLRRTFCVITLLLILTASHIATVAQSPDAATIDALMQEALKSWNVPGASLAIVRGNEVIHLKGYGVKDLKTAQPVTPDTIFAIGSTSKAFTTAAMAILVDDGKMNWDDPVRKHIPWFRLSDPLANEFVTMRDIVCHRTGLSRNDLLWYASPWKGEEIIRKVGFVKLSRPFRSTYQYQNIMFLTAGHAVGMISGGTWESFVEQRIFNPLGMKNSNFSATVAEKAADHATPHRKNKEEKVELIPWRNIDNIGPAGSINLTARDLSAWARMQLNGGKFDGRQIISTANLAETHTPQMVVRMEPQARAMNPDTTMMNYGLGWMIQDYRGRQIISHGGNIDGFTARITLIPEAKIGIIILANLNGASMNTAASNNLTDLLLGLKQKDWNTILGEQVKKNEAEAKARLKEREDKRFKETKPSRELAAYTGSYEDPAYGTATVALDQGALVLEWSSFKLRLEHFHFDTFVVREGRLENEQIVFTLGADGEVASMKLLETDFRKLKQPAKMTAGNGTR
jgi:CubicO group peptidase (beta-lactamase class C family)